MRNWFIVWADFFFGLIGGNRGVYLCDSAIGIFIMLAGGGISSQEYD